MSSRALIDIFEVGRSEKLFVGRPFGIDYAKANILTSDYWKCEVKGIPQGCFLLAFYEGEDDVSEALLLRALGPIGLPTDNNIISSMIEYYKDDVEVASRAGSRKESKLDAFTKHEFSFSGLECRILGSFYKTHQSDAIHFGADIENFYSANNYTVYKAAGNVLREIVNQKDAVDKDSKLKEFQIGKVRYSSTIRLRGMNADKDNTNTSVPVNISPKDFLGTRTALFGMTRTGKSNTIKKIIEATAKICNPVSVAGSADTPPINKETHHSPIGQIVFDVNGEYANPNLQDEGTAIYELYKDKDQVMRYSTVSKEGFEVLKINFYEQAEEGFNFINKYLKETGGISDYINNFLAISLERPNDINDDYGVKNRYERRMAAYFCCLYKAGFVPDRDFEVKFQSHNDIQGIEGIGEQNLNPQKGLNLEQACSWFEIVWNHYEEEGSYFSEYKKKKGREWADEELKALLVFLNRKKKGSSDSSNISGYLKIKTPDLLDLHTSTRDTYFAKDIDQSLRQGKIIIVDLSQGSEDIQRTFSDTICRQIFNNSLKFFTQNKQNNFIQFYFEESHNLFPKKEDKDLTDIYNRIAKEGAKLSIGMIYATQEVSSISSNILKNTQNWFIAHLNNEDELKELKKYYDFSDFTDSLIRFSSSNDKGFVRMKTYTNPFVVPVQIDRFTVVNGENVKQSEQQDQDEQDDDVDDNATKKENKLF